MQGWSRNLAALDIQFLRSPAMAHPDFFDQNALVAFAEVHGRQDELIESGCGDIQSLLPLGQSQVGLWKLPSVSLFEDFCEELAARLKHEYVCGTVSDISREGGEGSLFEVVLANGTVIHTDAVIMALGAIGRPIVPRALAEAPNLLPWSALSDDHTTNTTLSATSCQKILVVGGGLTAVQAAQRLVKINKSARVTLCSRRPLVERHFDLSVEWFDRRTATKCMSEFYHQPPSARLDILKQSRGGGSVPGIYLKELNRLEQNQRVKRIVGNATYVGNHGDEMRIEFDGCSSRGEVKSEEFDAIILACGVEASCQTHPLCQKLLARWPVEVVGGFPCVSEDLRWGTADKLFVVGGLGSLNIGPDAANLMGIKRAAQIVANALDCRCWLRISNVLKNPFDALLADTSDDDSSDDDDDDDSSDDEDPEE